MRSSRSPWAWCWLPVLAWLAGRVLHAPLLQAASGMLLADLLPGLALLRLMGLARRGAAWTLLGAGTLSPPLIAAVGLVTGLAHGPIEGVVIPLVALSLVVLSLPERSDANAPDDAEDARYARMAVALGVLFAGVVALGLLNPRLARWSDSWFHAAVYNEILRAGVPVTFPHFADQPLPYPWFFHVYLVALRPLVHTDPFLLMASVNIWTALLWSAGVYTLARTIGAAPRAGIAASLVAFLGVNPLGPAILAAQGLVGETSGWGVIRQQIANADFVLLSLKWWFPMFQASWFGRLWTPTAFNFALALSAFLLVLAFETWRRPSVRIGILFALGMALLVHWHTLTALSLGIALAVGVLLATLPRLRSGVRAALLPGVILAAGIVFAFLCARPYLQMVTLGGNNRVMIWQLSQLNLVGLVLSMGFVVAAAALAWRSLPQGPRGLWTGVALGMLVPFLFFDLPGEAEEKLYYPLFLVLTAAAGIVFARAWDRRGAARALVVLLATGGVLNGVITAIGCIGEDRPLRHMIDRDHPGRAELYTDDETAALAWIRMRAPREAVFLQPLRPQGTEPILVHGGRRLFLGPAEAFYRATFFETTGRPPIPLPVWQEVLRRDAIQRAAFAPDSLPPADLAELRREPWPVYVWWDASLAGGAISATLRDPAVTRTVFQSATVRVLELLPERNGR